MKDFNIYQGGYSDEELDQNGLEIVEWPATQDLMGLYGFYDHAELINDEDGLKAYGSSAFVVETEWLNWAGENGLIQKRATE